MFLKEDSTHSIGQFRREGVSGNFKLTWKSNGIDDMIVVFGPNEADVILDKNDGLKKHIDSNFNKANIHSMPNYNGITITHYNYRMDIVRNGGFAIPDIPGYYMVYGCEIENDNLVNVYIPVQSRRCANVQAIIEIKQSDFFLTRKTGFLRKHTEQIYSGYKQITVVKSVKGIAKNAVNYSCEKGKYKLPIPQDAIEGCKTFYVKAEKGEEIKFSSNNPGILIR